MTWRQCKWMYFFSSNTQSQEFSSWGCKTARLHTSKTLRHETSPGCRTHETMTWRHWHTHNVVCQDHIRHYLITGLSTMRHFMPGGQITPLGNRHRYQKLYKTKNRKEYGAWHVIRASNKSDWLAQVELKHAGRANHIPFCMVVI